MRFKRVFAALMLAVALAVVTPKPAEAVAFYCGGCVLMESSYEAFNNWWKSVNPFPLW